MNKDNLESLQILYNNTSVDDFSGLTPNEMDVLLYHPLGEGSPVRLRRNMSDGTLDDIPFFRLAEEYLKIIRREKFVKLTPTGALPRKILVELYGHGFLKEDGIEWGVVKLTKQADSVVLTTLPIVGIYSGLVVKRSGRFMLSGSAKKLLDANRRQEIFESILDSFTGEFNWSYNDGYPGEPVGQFGWAYTVFLLLKFGESERSIGFYAEKYLKAFPRLITLFPDGPLGPPEYDCKRCFSLRTFQRFLEWFGFVKIKYRGGLSDALESKVRRTEILSRVFEAG